MGGSGRGVRERGLPQLRKFRMLVAEKTERSSMRSRDRMEREGVEKLARRRLRSR
jgi:hypothetical protein